MNSTFESRWWSLRLPAGWNAHEDSDCVTFQAAIPIGALQISAARKSTGRVTEPELMDFTKDESALGTKIARVTHGEFTGFAATLTKDGRWWLKHWLCHDDVVIFVTYNVSPEHNQVELGEVRQVLNTLKYRGSKSDRKSQRRH